MFFYAVFQKSIAKKLDLWYDKQNKLNLEVVILTKRKTFITSIIALFIAVISLVYFTLPSYTNSIAYVRTMELSRMAIDDQAVLNEFEDAVVENEGSLTSFAGYKVIDESMFEEFDSI